MIWFRSKLGCFISLFCVLLNGLRWSRSDSLQTVKSTMSQSLWSIRRQSLLIMPFEPRYIRPRCYMWVYRSGSSGSMTRLPKTGGSRKHAFLQEEADKILGKRRRWNDPCKQEVDFQHNAHGICSSASLTPPNARLDVLILPSSWTRCQSSIWMHIIRKYINVSLASLKSLTNPHILDINVSHVYHRLMIQLLFQNDQDAKWAQQGPLSISYVCWMKCTRG